MTTQNKLHYKARQLQVNADHAGRRIDNFLAGYLKDIPKSRLYQMLRKGEVRVNSARIKQDHRLKAGDKIRIPPLFLGKCLDDVQIPDKLKKILTDNILYEDNSLLVLNKPAGISVHGGTKQQFGIIEAMRKFKPDRECLDLVHRLDKNTSGCLLIAKSHRTLRSLHEQLKKGDIEKNYIALLKHRIKRKFLEVNIPLKKNKLVSKERIVQANSDGKKAVTKFLIEKHFNNSSLAKIRLLTGRTHQIRVHAAQLGYPVAGDIKYGDRNFNKELRKAGLKRLFLHAESLKFINPESGKYIYINAPLPDELTKVLKKL